MLIHRYKETRRRHPLSDSFEGSITQSIHYEREVLRPVKEAADYLIDTTFLSPAQLKNRISALFWKAPIYPYWSTVFPLALNMGCPMRRTWYLT